MHQSQDDTSAHIWTDDDLSLIEAILDQVAQTAENLRLFEETRQQADYERAVGEITQRLRQSPNLEILSRTAAEAISQILGASGSVVDFNIEQQDDSSNGSQPG